MMMATFVMCLIDSATAQIYFNGKPSFIDNGSDMVLVTIPQGIYGKDLVATVQVDPQLGWENIIINGQPLKDKPITFDCVAGNKEYELCASKNRQPVIKKIMFTYLPIMSIEGDADYEYSPATITLMEPNGNLSDAMTAKIKWRGHSTNSDSKHKRNYSIKFVDANGDKQNQRLLGMRRDNHWKLDAGQADMGRVRNRVATELWNDMCTPPYYYDQAPDALTGARGEWLELMVNGNYRGIYALSECIDRKQVKVMKYDENNGDPIIRGQIWKSEAWSQATAFKSYPGYNNNSPTYNKFETVYPDFEDVHPTNYSTLYNALKFMTNGTMNSFNEQGHEYFDIPVMIDYTIFTQVLNATDNNSKNIYWLCYDRETDKKLTLAVWDLDVTVGQNYDIHDPRGGKAYAEYYYMTTNNIFKKFYDSSCIYHKDMLQRYWELRKTWLSEESLVGRYTRAIDKLIDCGAAAREEARWSGDSDIGGYTLNFADEKEYITTWLKTRLAYVDRTLMRHPCDINADGVVNAADLSLLYSALMGWTTMSQQYDANGDGVVNSADIVTLNHHIFDY